MNALDAYSDFIRSTPASLYAVRDGSIVGASARQTLSNKTLSTPPVPRAHYRHASAPQPCSFCAAHTLDSRGACVNCGAIP